MILYDYSSRNWPWITATRDDMITYKILVDSFPLQDLCIAKQKFSRHVVKSVRLLANELP